jgi:tRNA-uridine 2-sulfurtransferase
VYVVGIDRERDRVVVGPRTSAQRQSVRARDMRWLSDVPAGPVRALVQVRHRARPVAAEVVADGADAVITFDGEPVVAAPGQAAVLYHDDRVLGGGWIRPTTRA